MLSQPESSGEHDLRRLRTLYKALGDGTRLRVIGLLAEAGPLPVTELSSRVGLSQPLISWHLRILRLAGLIDTQRNGRQVICHLRTAAFEELHAIEAQNTRSPAVATAPPNISCPGTFFCQRIRPVATSMAEKVP
jgi:DNA-binding transcriptional ArsR family regulator